MSSKLSSRQLKATHKHSHTTLRKKSLHKVAKHNYHQSQSATNTQIQSIQHNSITTSSHSSSQLFPSSTHLFTNTIKSKSLQRHKLQQPQQSKRLLSTLLPRSQQLLVTNVQRNLSTTTTTNNNNMNPNDYLSLFPNGYEHPYGNNNLSRTRMLPTTTQSYDELRNFKIPLPKMYNIGVDISDKHVYNGNGHKPALIYVNQESGKDYTVDYKFISEQSNKIANGLKHMGIQKGDRVGILLSQSLEVAIIHAAISKVGGVAVPLSILFGPEALEYRLQASGAKALFLEPNKIDEFIEIQDKLPDMNNIIVTPHLSSLAEHDSIITPEQLQHSNDLKGLTQLQKKSFFTFSEILLHGSKQYNVEMTSIDDNAVIIFTSGTTGNPKAALHRQSCLLGHLPGIEFFYDLFPRQNDIIFTGSDVSWIGGLFNTLLTSMHHGVPVLLNRAKKFDADYMFRLFEQYKIKNAFLPPTALKLMKEVPNPTSKYKLDVRSIGSGGESLGDSILSWGRSTFNLDINEFYGQTECNLVLGNSYKLKPVKNGSMGVPIPGHQVEILDDNGTILPIGKVGQICIKGPHPIMFSGYLNNPQATKEKFIGEWLGTGDLGKKDDDGYFYYVGRNDDIISSAGYRIGPAEVETSLMHHPIVSNAAAIGVPDELRNEIVKAFIVLTPSAQDQYFGGQEQFLTFLKQYPHGNYDLHPVAKDLSHQLMDFVKTKLAKHEFPRQVEFVSSLPLTTTSKVIRKTLKKQEYERYYHALGKDLPDGMF